MLLFLKCFTMVIKAKGSRACAWVLYLKYAGGQCSWDLQYCFIYTPATGLQSQNVVIRTPPEGCCS